MMVKSDRTPWAEKASALYDEAYARRYRAHDEQLPASVPSQELAAWLREVCRRFEPPIDVLDLGCGTGRYFWAARGVRSLIGVDASPAMLAEARQPYRPEQITAESITLVQGDLLTHDFPPASFDLVYSIGVLAEHAPLTRALASKVHTWLRPGGRFAFTAVHPDSPSIPLTLKRRLASLAVPIAPGPVGRALRLRLLAGGLYADEAFIRSVVEPAFAIETMERFTSEAHLHVRVVVRKVTA
jgi:SAM-dependent methyltransferase